jgi:hypothetical protein
MTINPIADGNKTTPLEITPLFGGAKIVLEQTPKAITPFGGLASLIAFLHEIGLGQQIQKAMPFEEPTSNNAIPLPHTLAAFLMTVVVGGRRFAHSQWLRADHARRRASALRAGGQRIFRQRLAPIPGAGAPAALHHRGANDFGDQTPLHGNQRVEGH